MTRLIDADAFRREIDTYPPFDKKTQGSSMMANFAKHMLLDALNNMPTVDAVPVIRCKDCKHRVLIDNVWRCLYSDFIVPEHYCGYAERKE